MEVSIVKLSESRLGGWFNEIDILAREKKKSNKSPNPSKNAIA
jgi:hypothetical protein